MVPRGKWYSNSSQLSRNSEAGRRETGVLNGADDMRAEISWKKITNTSRFKMGDFIIEGNEV
jgi:hypothetical protein